MKCLCEEDGQNIVGVHIFDINTNEYLNIYLIEINNDVHISIFHK